MTEPDPATVELPAEHMALVRRVVRDARGRPDPLLILADRFTELADHLGAGGVGRASRQATLYAHLLRDAARPAPRDTGEQSPAPDTHPTPQRSL